MKHLASNRFWECFNRLPAEVQELARRNFETLRRDPGYPSLHFKEICGGRFHSVRAGLHYRALGVPVEDGVLWFWIGTHAEYDRLIRL